MRIGESGESTDKINILKPSRLFLFVRSSLKGKFPRDGVLVIFL